MGKQSNNMMGMVGFICALAALVIGYISNVSFLKELLWLAGLVLSIIGLFKKPKTLAIAGVCISLIGFILLVVFVGLGAVVAFLK